jgi:glycosyltransferase involved in cell wall biosynthesis
MGSAPVVAKSDILVSVIMPCLNAQATLEQAISSVLQQDHQNLELLVIDDGSVDGSQAIALGFQETDSRVVVLESGRAGGVSGARNRGLEAARGRFVTFLDADDYLLQGSLRRRIQLCLKEEVYLVYGPYERKLPSGLLKSVQVPARVSRKDMLKKNYIGNLTGLYDARALGVTFQKPIPHEDYAMWCELLEKTEFAYAVSGGPLAVYRVSGGSLSGNKLRAARWHWGVLRAGLKLPFSKALYYQGWYIFLAILERLRERLFR